MRKRKHREAIIAAQLDTQISHVSSELSAMRRRGGLGFGFEAGRNWYSSEIICARSSRDLASIAHGARNTQQIKLLDNWTPYTPISTHTLSLSP
jgi:hypothetical protein